ncbi:hypothetical protein [Sphingomonas sp. S2-65]|uniref:hypothetical protein n=1 Tax=Sphingomonas sp. S2-65 TaxID=2903960 RepID=UPI001F440B4F|nr:hypothetical protein [Sphingomonas sp. S2-65]UYY60090.1 hypothetical protein LZ586_08440 [Sphingomonas sp. S2-65]
MARVHIELGSTVKRGGPTEDLPLLRSAPRVAATLNSAANSTTAELQAQAGEVWTVSATGGAVFVAFGADADAGVPERRIVLDGQARDFAATAGEKIAVKDA